MQVADRTKFVDTLGLTGFAGTGALAKQRCRINELMALGACRRVEQCILQSVLPDIVECEYGSVSLHSLPGSLSASYRLGEMTMSQVFKTPLQVKNWLLSVTQQHKSGTLSKSLEAAQQAVKGTVAFEKAAADLAKKQPESAFTDLLQPHAGTQVPDDHTAEFLKIQQLSTVQARKSTVHTHKGNLARAVLAMSKNNHVSCLILGKELKGPFVGTVIVPCPYISAIYIYIELYIYIFIHIYLMYTIFIYNRYVCIYLNTYM